MNIHQILSLKILKVSRDWKVRFMCNHTTDSW